MGFEYRYGFSIDEDILERYDYHIPCHESSSVKFAIEIKTNFMLRGRRSDDDDDDEERAIDSEIFAVCRCSEDRLRNDTAARLKHYRMSGREIAQLIDEALLFGKEISSAACRLQIQISVDLNIYTLQQEGESMDAAADRAIRTEHLPPLYLCPVIDSTMHKAEDEELMYFLEEMEMAAVRVNDVEEVLSVMEACGVCGRYPVVGTAMSKLRCGHAFHNYCIARRLEEDKCCSTCRRPVLCRPPIPQLPRIKYKFDGEDDFC